ncbi:MAG TPA: UdgX family uracil-DNA binding protein [Solirubrobacterales bacterium]|jgi:DNA polymerase|nr:UdgX family uracil-DNA binding protein [Solirubrobacterales bacterium]
MTSRDSGGAEALIPAQRGGVKALRAAAAGCRACPLWRNATQTVFGAGPARAPLMLVGEQPGDREDRDGRPFVGPAGHLLDHAMADAGIDVTRTYRTNAVKHFKWKPRGKRRIHQRPTKLEVEACRPWLEAELDRVRPEVVGILGSVAAQSLLGNDFRVSKRRGELLTVDFAPVAVATVHPSAVLRAGESDQRAEAYVDLVDDLRVLAKAF